MERGASVESVIASAYASGGNLLIATVLVGWLNAYQTTNV